MVVKPPNRENHCVKIEKVSLEEQTELYFLKSFLSKALVVQGQVLNIKQKKVDYKNMHILNFLLENLILFLFQKEDDSLQELNFDSQETLDSICVKRQMMVRDMGVLDIVISLLQFPMKIKKTYDRPLESLLTLRHTMSLCYKALRLSIMEYRPNELYASQWLGLLIEDVFGDHSKVQDENRKTLKELYDNNKRVLETRIDMDTIFKFVYFLAENKHSKFFDFLDPLIICKDQPISVNQNRITRIILDDESLRKQLVMTLSSNSNNVNINFGEFSYTQGIAIEDFKYLSKARDGGVVYRYAIGLLRLFSNLCLGDNWVAIDGFKQIYSLKQCINIIMREKLDTAMRSAFAELTHRLWTMPQSTLERFEKISMVKLWKNKAEEEGTSKLFLSFHFRNFKEFMALFEYISRYMQDILELLEHRPDASNQVDFIFTFHLFTLLRDVIKLRLFHPETDIPHLKAMIMRYLNLEVQLDYLNGEELDEVQNSINSSKVICLEILKQFYLLKIDLEIEFILDELRSRSLTLLAEDMQNKNNPENQEDLFVTGSSKRDLNKKDSGWRISNTERGVEVNKLLEFLRSPDAAILISQQFMSFVESIQLDDKLVQYLIRQSISIESTPVKNKALELLLDVFSIEFYIEKYLDQLIVVKEVDETNHFDRITDAFTMMEMHKDRFKTRVFTDSDEYHVALALTRLLWPCWTT